MVSNWAWEFEMATQLTDTGQVAAANIVLGTDTFIVKVGKIVVQTFAAKVEPR
jgi:hypothetical protein